MSGVSPLERKALLALISLIRDREPDPDEWASTDIPLSVLHERCYAIDPGRSWEIQRRNQRQAMRRALGRLHRDGIIEALALAWANVADGQVIRWQGGGSRKSDGLPGGTDTPRWRLVGLTREGVALAEALERDEAQSC